MINVAIVFEKFKLILNNERVTVITKIETTFIGFCLMRIYAIEVEHCKTCFRLCFHSDDGSIFPCYLTGVFRCGVNNNTVVTFGTFHIKGGTVHTVSASGEVVVFTSGVVEPAIAIIFIYE